MHWLSDSLQVFFVLDFFFLVGRTNMDYKYSGYNINWDWGGPAGEKAWGTEE